MKPTILILLLALVSCTNKESAYEKEYHQQLYRPLSHVKESFDSIKQVSSFYFDNEKLSETEKDTLITILREQHKEFIVTTDNEIYVSLLTVPSLYNMYVLDVELRKRVNDVQLK